MQDNVASSISPGLLSGRLEGISLPDLMWSLCRGRRTGVLNLTREAVRKAIYVQEGRIVFAASSDPDDRLGELLLREGAIKLEQLENALRFIGSGKRLGTILVEAGDLSPADLVEGVLTQVRSIVLEAFTWEYGEYRFDEGPLPTEEVITLGMQTGEILLQGIRGVRSFTRVRRSVGPPRVRYRRAADTDRVLDGLSLGEGERQLLVRLEGEGTTIDALCREVFLSNFEIYQTLWALKALGAIEEVEYASTARSDVAFEGLFAGEGIAPVLVRLCRAGETGVLYLTRGALERTIHVRDGRCVFATSSNIDDGLVAYLLRRGVISLRDREETARRLLSNKRVGTILREMGVLDGDDLRAMVREHLTEIILDTLTWDSGEYAFAAGELPTIEEITLDTPIESLISAGLARIASWSRVRDGIGGLERPLTLTPDFLAVLDGMAIGPEEWEVVTALRDPRSAMEICRTGKLGDFRVCSILWTLRVLGAVQAIPAFVEGVDDLEDFDEAEEPEEVETTAAAEPVEEPPAVEVPEPAPEPRPVERFRTDPRFDDRPEVAAAPPDGIPIDGLFDEPQAPVEPESPAGPVEDDREVPVVEASGEPDLVFEERPEPVVEDSDDAPSFDAPIDSPADSTLYLTRDEVADALEGTPDVEVADAAATEDERTSEFPREAVEAGLEAAEAESEPEPDLPDWDPPSDLDDQISRFNARQRLLYRSIRAEVGAGAPNFVRSCCGQVAPGDANPFEGAQMNADGTWDIDGLRRAALEGRIPEPWREYERLIALELEMLRMHLGESRAQSLRQQIEQIEPLRAV